MSHWISIVLFSLSQSGLLGVDLEVGLGYIKA